MKNGIRKAPLHGLNTDMGPQSPERSPKSTEHLSV